MIEELFEFDTEHKDDDTKYIIGTDEAGRGPGAGPVFAAAVAFKEINQDLMISLNSLNDSKKLSEKKRDELYEIIVKSSVFSVKAGSVEDIESKNILNASLDAMKEACTDVMGQLNTSNVKILVDGNKKIKNFSVNMETIVKGDGKSAAIAAASILAKVTRDRFMCNLDKEYPQYGWAKNKGYLCRFHINAIQNFGITKWHRKKFLRNILGESKQLSLY